MIESTVWRDSYSVGHPLLDAQHRRLLGLCERLTELDEQSEVRPAAERASAIHGILHELADYSRVHFAAEEKMLAECGYPGLAEQQAEHGEYQEKLLDFLLRAMDSEVATGELIAFLAQWWVDHILVSDMPYKDYLPKAH